MTTASSVKRNVLASWGVQASNVVIGFFLTRYILDVLGVSTYGSWLFINSIASYLNLLYCGFGETISRYVSKYHADNDQRRMNEVVSLVSFVFRGLGCFAFFLACMMAATAQWWGRWDPEFLIQVRIACVILGLNVAVGMAGTPYGGVLHGLRRFDLERGVSFALDIVRLILFLVLLRGDYGIVIIAAIFFVITLCENLAYLILAYRLVPQLEVRWKHVKRETFDECISFSSMSFANSIAAQVINASDLVVIGFMLGQQSTVFYNFGLRLAQFCRQPTDKIAHICLPTAGALHSEADRSKRMRFLLRTLVIVMLLIDGLSIGAWYFGGDVLQLWVGPKLTPENHQLSHRILLILLGAHVIAVPCGIFRVFLFAVGNVTVPATIYMVEAVLNLSLSLVLCKLFGIEGVAWGTAIPVAVIELGVLMPYALRNLGLSWSRLLRDGIIPLITPLLSLWIYAGFLSRQTWSHNNWPALIAVAIGGGAVLAATRWFGELQSKSSTMPTISATEGQST